METPGVYVARHADQDAKQRVKIGHSNALERRLYDSHYVSTYTSETPELTAAHRTTPAGWYYGLIFATDSKDNARKLEQSVHRMLHTYRINNTEMFRIGCVEHIRDCVKLAGKIENIKVQECEVITYKGGRVVIKTPVVDEQMPAEVVIDAVEISDIDVSDESMSAEVVTDAAEISDIDVSDESMPAEDVIDAMRLNDTDVDEAVAVLPTDVIHVQPIEMNNVQLTEAIHVQPIQHRFMCGQCGAHFTCKRNLITHKGTKCQDKLACKLCHKRYGNERCLKDHIKTHKK